MKTKTNLIVACIILAVGSRGFAAVHYVDLNSTNPTPPYTNWATAARVIQDAVDAAAAGEEIVVTNGIYATGGRAVIGTLPNRVAVDKPLTLRSVNGPQFTTIRGQKAPGGGNGDGAIRCVYLTNGATMSGFTLTNGATRLSYDPIGHGGGLSCEWATALASNCVVVGNSAWSGGGVYGGTLNNCTLIANSADDDGGGAREAILNDCTLTSNSAGLGGGASSGTLNNCALIGNSAETGGGASETMLNNCTLTGNWASGSFIPLGGIHGGEGGAALGSTLNNCALTANSSFFFGGGAYESTLNNCTLTSNSAHWVGGGAYGCTLVNCITYFNTAPEGANYDDASFLVHCCTTPMPSDGIDNISADPQLASATHLSALSPCIAKGSYTDVSGVDIDGELWANPPSIGCDEYHAGAINGPLSVGITPTFTNVIPGFSVSLAALIGGRTTLSVWAFGDGSLEINQPYVVHSWSAPGNYFVTLWGFNESHPDGVAATMTVHVDEGTYYVAANSAKPAPPYTSWATAATNIQDAVDAAAIGGTVLVTNGVYATGGRAVDATMTNRVAVTKPLTVRSVNGPQFTVIKGRQVSGTTNGGGAIRCVYLTNGASLVGFTLTNGATRERTGNPGEDSGGGLCCESARAVVSNCVVIGNSAGNGGGGAWSGTLYNSTLIHNSTSDEGSGGAAFNCTLSNCTLTGNWAQYGGGADDSTLYNCTLTGNSAHYGGGADYSTLYNCIVYFNTAPQGADYDSSSTLNYCCTGQWATSGVGNIHNPPMFVNYAGGNLRLQHNSPCINTGNNTYAPPGPDLDGNSRIVGGTVDIGAYEFQTPTSVISYAWLQQFGLPTDGSADYADPDYDGMNNWQEWIAGTDPINPSSVLTMLASTGLTNRAGVSIIWQSVSGKIYSLERSTNLGYPPTFSLLQSNIVGQPGTTTYTDTSAGGAGPFFYRVCVGN